MKKLILSFALLQSIATLFSQDVNVLKNFNGDFENGIYFWRFFEVPENIGSSYELTPDAVSGSQAVKLNWVASDGTVNDRGFDNWDANVPVIPGSAYTIRAYMKSDVPSGLHVNMIFGFFDANKVVIHEDSKQCDLTSTYTEYEFSLTAPAEAAYCWIAFRMFDSNNQRAAGEVYLDNVRLMGPSTDLPPRVMETSLPSEDVPVAIIDVTEAPYNAMNDGSADATSAFNDAISRAVVAGGGVVFVPSGSYRLEGNLNIPERVILRGEWVNPENNKEVQGTILMPYAGKGIEDGAPFIKVNRGAGIKNLSIWYPEQSAESVSPYPWTIHCHPDGPQGSGNNTSVINVTLVNAYNGIKIGPNSNELHYIRNVYGTPLNQGIWLSQTTDIGRLMNVHFGPAYWSGSGLTGAPSEQRILTWMQNNTTTGIVMGRSDWEYIYDVSLVGFHTGVKIYKYTDHGPNGVIYGMQIDKSRIGIDLSDVSNIGWAITNSDIRVEGEGSACILGGDNFRSIVQFNTCTFGGDPESAVKFTANSTGRLSFQNCTFEQWGHNGDDPAIDCPKGSLSLLGNTFLLDKLHVRLGELCNNAQIVDNIFPSGINLENNSDGEILVSRELLQFKKLDVPPHSFASFPRPAKDSLYNVADFGGVGDGVTENTQFFQAALNQAGANGGGTVYIPPGIYRIEGHLTIPTGVELRGLWDVPHHTISGGSVLFAYEGKNDPDGTPFISLESGSGARGFTVWYPEQTTDSFYAYPWSIRTLGEDCWIFDVVLANAYQGVDLATHSSAGHKVSYLGGSPLMTGISVDKNSGEGWIENIQYNPHYWLRNPGYPAGGAQEFNPLRIFQQTNLEAIKIASATKEHILGTFVFAAKHGIYLAPDDGNSSIDIFLHGTDAGSNGAYLESNSGSRINFINAQLVLLGQSQQGIITTAPEFGAEAAFFNTISWGGSGPTCNLNGSGKLLIQQIHTRNGRFIISDGTTRIENVKITPQLDPQYVIGTSVDTFKLFGSYAANGFKANHNGDRSTVEMDYCYRKNVKAVSLESGWETNDIQNYWNNTLFGHKDLMTGPQTSFLCAPVTSEEALSGTSVLKVSGDDAGGDTTLLYKIFNDRISILNNTTLTYGLNPQNEQGKTGYIDLLFTDGTLLSDLSPVAEDGLPLNAPRGTIGAWSEVSCSVGSAAEGKTVQTILTGATPGDAGAYGFLIDDLILQGEVSAVQPELLDGEMRLYPNPVKDLVTIQINCAAQSTIELRNLNGQLVCKKKMEGTVQTIDLSAFGKGVYFITIRSKSFVSMEKIIKL